MKVYVLTEVWQIDSGDCGNNVMVYSDIEKAQHDLNLLMEQARKDFHDLETEETEYVDGDMSWSIWEKEEYCYNHIDLTITECDVI